MLILRFQRYENDITSTSKNALLIFVLIRFYVQIEDTGHKKVKNLLHRMFIFLMSSSDGWIKVHFRKLWNSQWLFPQSWNRDTSSCKISLFSQGLIEKNNLGVCNVDTPATRYVLGYYTFNRLLTFKSKLDINLPFCFWLQY